MTNEKATQYNKRNHTHRVVIIALTLAICLCSYIPCLANTKVEIQANSGTGGTPFHGYSINTTVADSYIDNGAMFFSNAWNSFALNIAKTGSTVSRLRYLLENTIANKIDSITTNQTTINTNIVSLQGLVSTVNNSIGYVNGTLGGVRQDIQGLYPLLNLDEIIDELGTSSYKVFDQNIDNYSVFTSNCSYQKLDGGKTIRLYNFNGTTPAFIGFANMTLNQKSYYVGTFDIKTNTSVNLSMLANGQLMYSQTVPILSEYTKFVSYREPSTQTSYTGGVYIINGNVDSSTEIYIKNMRYYLDLNLEYQTKLNNSIIASKYDDTDILNAINNLSLVDNNVKINVNVTNNDSQNVQDVIPFIRSFFDNNISLSDFITESGDVQNNWFSQQNQDIMNSLSGGYIDLYD